MAVVVFDLSETTFSVNGIVYHKNFMSLVRGDFVEIVNVYSSILTLPPGATIYSGAENALLPPFFV